MTRSHAHRVLPTVLALGALALAGCGSAGGDQPTTAPAAAAGSSTPSAAASATPTPSPTQPDAAAGILDAATGFEGSQDKGRCEWLTGQQVATLGLSTPKALLEGTLSSGTGPKGSTIRRCFTSLGKEAGITIGTVTFTSRDDLEAFTAGVESETTTAIPDLPQPAAFDVSTSPRSLNQGISSADGAVLRYISVSVLGEKAKVVKGKNVPATDRRPALRALHDQLIR